MRNLLIPLGVLGFGLAGAAPPESARAVLDCAAANAPEDSFQQAVEMTVSKDGTVQRTILATFAGQRGNGGFMLNIGVLEPADLSGTAVLLREQGKDRDDLKLYLPALRRVRTVTGAMAGEDLLGTDFSYRDIKQVYGAFDDAGAELLEAGVWQERPIHRVGLQPSAEEESPYSQLIIGIDQQNCVTLLIDFIGPQQTAVKRLEGDHASIMQVGERQLLGRYTMRDLDKGSQTQLKLGEPRFDDKVARSAFHPTSFYNFHNRADRP